MTFTALEVLNILIEYGRNDPRFKSGEEIKYSPGMVCEILEKYEAYAKGLDRGEGLDPTACFAILCGEGRFTQQRTPHEIFDILLKYEAESKRYREEWERTHEYL